MVAILVLVALMVGRGKAGEPLAEKYLLEGKLSAGEKALQDRLKHDPKDDQARFGLGIVQFLQTFEHLGGSLYKYGLRTEKGFLRPPAEVREFFPQNPKPQKLTYTILRQMLQTMTEDLVRAETTLKEIKDPNVKLPLHVGLIKIDPFGLGKPINAAFLLRRMEGFSEEARKKAETLVIGFDRGDVSWLRGYCHFLAGWVELLLAVNGHEPFECGAHLFFQDVETPYTFLVQDRKDFPDQLAGAFVQGTPGEERDYMALMSDAISFLLHMNRMPMQVPERTKAALGHFEAGVAQAKEMWQFILAETDDDNEWIPNPKQTGVMNVKVTQQMVDVWLECLDEIDQLLKGKKLIPFWRGKQGERGVNLRRLFTEPRTFDAVEWVQGTAATPYLEKGTFTRLSDPDVATKFSEVFGGPFGILGFGFWFN
jgi:hypothetical protein